MNLARYYNLLGLKAGADLEQIKTSYRRLARQYHPDINPSREAQGRFIQITDAYKHLVQAVLEQKRRRQSSANATPRPFIPFIPLSPREEQLKWNSYQSLQELLRQRRLVRAIALVEGLAQRLPQDSEVRQWQAITYQQWGRQLYREGKFTKARIYLNKALKCDPYNRSLWQEVCKDLREIQLQRESGLDEEFVGARQEARGKRQKR